MNVEELVKNGINSSKIDSKYKHQDLKISCGPSIKKNAKNQADNDEIFSTTLVHNMNDSMLLPITKKSPFLCSQSFVKESHFKASKDIDSPYKCSKAAKSNTTNPSHLQMSYFKKQRDTRQNQKFNRFNDFHQGLDHSLACNDGDITPQSDNQYCTQLSMQLPKQSQDYHVKVKITIIDQCAKHKK